MNGVGIIANIFHFCFVDGNTRDVERRHKTTFIIILKIIFFSITQNVYYLLM